MGDVEPAGRPLPALGLLAAPDAVTGESTPCRAAHGTERRLPDRIGFP
ncbi:MAG: hypothetical protein LH477_13035 [Nocardioides sp.]|nr:hypothetical protein [Nocardioides sp.]